MSFANVPRDVMFNVGGYLPVGSVQTRRSVAGVDPYDPALITEMLQLGLDPTTVIAKERLRQRKERELARTVGYHVAVLLQRLGLAWYAEENQDDHGKMLIEVTGGVPIRDLEDLGLIVEDVKLNGVEATVTDPNGSLLYQDLVKADRFLSKDKEETIDDVYYSR